MCVGRITKGYEISELTGEFSVQIEFARFINNKDTASPRPSRVTARGVFATLYCCGEGQTEVVGEVARSKVTRRFIGVRRSREFAGHGNSSQPRFWNIFWVHAYTSLQMS